MTRKLDGPRFAAGGLGTAILDSAHALVITLDVEGRIAGFNRACELLTGYSASEVIGTRIWDKLLPDEAIEPIQRFFAGLPEGGEIPEEHENAWVTRDGRRPIIAWNNNALRNAKGEIELVVGIGVDITGRKTNSDRLARAQQTAKIGSWEWTVATNREYWSDQMYRNLGLEPGCIEANVDKFYEHVHPDDRKGVRRTIQATIETGKPYSFGFRVVWPDGTEHLVHEEGEALLGDNDETVGLAGTMQNVTELHASENHLRRLTRSFANAQRIAHIGNWDWDAVTKVEWWSDEVYRIMGLEPGSATSSYRAFRERSHPDDWGKVEAAIKTAQDSLQSYDMDFRIVRLDGEVRVVHETGECILDADGRFTGLTGTVQDITGQHKAEHELSETAQRLKAAMRLARLGNWEWDPDTNLLKLSEETLRICGLGPEHAEVDNEFLMAMIPAEEHARVLDVMNRAISTDTTYTNEYHIVRPNGDRRTVLEHGETFHDETTGRTRLVGTIQDITERQRAEEELGRTLKRLADAQTAARIGNWEWDAATDQDWWSEQQFRNYGIEAPAGFVPGENYLQFAHPADREAAKQAVDRSVETGTPLDIEFRAIGADGVERVLWVYGANETNADGRVIRTVGTTQDVTVRQHAEQELARTTERLEEAQRIANIGHWEWRPGSTDTIWSDEMHRIFGLELGAVQPTHDSFFGMVHEDDREAIATMMADTLETGQSYTTEFRIIRTDGAMRHVFERGERYIDEQTGTPSIRGIMQDITERRAADEKLREIAANLTNTQRIARLGSWIWEFEEDKEWWSDEVYRIVGLEVGSVVFGGYDFLKYVHPDDRERISEVQDRSLREGAPYDVEYRLIRTDGLEIVISEYGEIEHDANGKPLRMHGTAQDITERKAAEEKLRETAENLEKSQRMAKLGSWVWEIEEDKEWWSDEIYRMVGWELDPAYVGGREFLKYVHPDDRERVSAALAKSLREQVPYVAEYRFRHADGHEIIISENAEIEYDGAGKPLRMRGTTQDITELKRIEQQLARLNAELEQRVEERTAELHAAQGELVKSERLSTLGQLTATVSHELRNPLGAMRTSMYVIEKKTESEDQRLRAAIERVNRNITRCDQIIDELLDFTRIRDLDIRQTDIDNWLGAVLDEQNIPGGVAVKRKFGVTGTRAPIDGNRLRRAFINIFENACQAVSDPHHEGGTPARPLVTVETRLKKDRLEIIVSDNGAGIPDDIREKIFEPLFSTKNFGVGLGLPTVMQIMEQHGGGVEIGERHGGGVKFALWLPLAGELQSTNS